MGRLGSSRQSQLHLTQGEVHAQGHAHRARARRVAWNHGVDSDDRIDGSRRHRDFHQDWRHVPAFGPCVAVRDDPGGDEGLLLVHQRPPRARRQARRLRPPDHLELQGRPVLAAERRAAHARPRRAGQRVRGRRLARHRGQPRDPAVPELEEGPAHARLDGRDDVGRGLEAVPVDDRLAARLPARGQVLRAGDRPQQPEREDRRHLPERRLRQGLHRGPRGRSRRQGVEHRRQGAVRGHRAERRLADREAEGERCDDLRDPRDADQDDPVVRDGERAQVVAGRDLHELRLGHRHVPDAREGERRRRPRQQDVHDAVREGPGEPEVGQRRRDEALQDDHGEVLPQGPRHRRPQPLRRRHRRGLRRAALRRRQEPDARLADEGVPDLEPGEPVPAAGRQAADGRRRTSSRSSASSSSSSRTARSSPCPRRSARPRAPSPTAVHVRPTGPASPAPSSFPGCWLRLRGCRGSAPSSPPSSSRGSRDGRGRTG